MTLSDSQIEEWKVESSLEIAEVENSGLSGLGDLHRRIIALAEELLSARRELKELKEDPADLPLPKAGKTLKYVGIQIPGGMTEEEFSKEMRMAVSEGHLKMISDLENCRYRKKEEE